MGSCQFEILRASGVYAEDLDRKGVISSLSGESQVVSALDCQLEELIGGHNRERCLNRALARYSHRQDVYIVQPESHSCLLPICRLVEGRFGDQYFIVVGRRCPIYLTETIISNVDEQCVVGGFYVFLELLCKITVGIGCC